MQLSRQLSEPKPLLTATSWKMERLWIIVPLTIASCWLKEQTPSLKPIMLSGLPNKYGSTANTQTCNLKLQTLQTIACALDLVNWKALPCPTLAVPCSSFISVTTFSPEPSARQLLLLSITPGSSAPNFWLPGVSFWGDWRQRYEVTTQNDKRCTGQGITFRCVALAMFGDCWSIAF